MDGLSALPWTARWCQGTLPCPSMGAPTPLIDGLGRNVFHFRSYSPIITCVSGRKKLRQQRAVPLEVEPCGGTIIALFLALA